MSIPHLEYDDNGLYRVKSHSTEPSRFVEQSGWRAEIQHSSADKPAIKQTTDLGFALQRQQFDAFWPKDAKPPVSTSSQCRVTSQSLSQSINTSKRVGVGSGAGDQSIPWQSITQASYSQQSQPHSDSPTSSASRPVAMALGYGPKHRHYRMYLNEEEKEQIQE